MSLGDMLSDVGDFIENNPWALALAAAPIMGPMAAGGAVGGASSANALTAAASSAAGVPAIGSAVAGGLAGNVAVAPTAAGMSALGGTQLGMLAAQNQGLFANPMGAASAEMALPGSSFGMPGPMGKLDPMKAMQMAALSGGGQQQRPGMPSAPRPRPMNPQAVQSFMKYAPMGIPMNQGMNTAGRFGLLTGNKYGFS